MHIKKREKENLITKISWFFFAIDLTTKKKKTCKSAKKKKKNLNPEQPATTNQQNSMKTKTKKLKSRATHNHKLTKFHEQSKRIERAQYIEIKESKKHVLITSK